MDTKKISAMIREIADLLIADEAVENEQPKVDEVDEVDEVEVVEIEPEIEEKETGVIDEVAKDNENDFNKRLAEAMKILKGGR